MTILLGAHMGAGTKGINHEVEIHGAEVAQIFIGSPMVWSPPRRIPANANGRPTWNVPVYVHCSYLVNPASSDPVTRARSITSLNHQLSVASLVGAKGLVVHGGHNAGGSVDEAVRLWSEAFKKLDFHVPLLIENTAGGTAAPTRSWEGMAKLWKVAKDYPNVGVCIDTCHAHASGMGTQDLGQRMLDITGRIDLVHANGSLDRPGSGRDKHTNLFDSDIPWVDMINLIRTADAPVILETPAGLPAHLRELSTIRGLLSIDSVMELQRPTQRRKRKAGISV